jgi:hypothetical protein
MVFVLVLLLIVKIFYYDCLNPFQFTIITSCSEVLAPAIKNGETAAWQINKTTVSLSTQRLFNSQEHLI